METDPNGGGAQRVLVVLHLFYTELWPEFRRYLANLAPLGPWDLVVTCHADGFPGETRRDILAFRPDARFLALPAQGFDIGPFCEAIRASDPNAYDVVIKIHSKRDVRPGNYYGRRLAGAEWRRIALDGLLGPHALPRVLALLRGRSRCGFVAPARLLVRRDSDFAREQTRMQAEAWSLTPLAEDAPFAIGSMFAARMDALSFLRDPKFSIDSFPPSGRDHHTPAHSLERIIPALIARQGFRVAGIRHLSLRSLLRLPADAVCSLLWPFSAVRKDRSRGAWLWRDGALLHTPPDPAARRRPSLAAKIVDLLPYVSEAILLRLSRRRRFDPSFYRHEAALAGPFRLLPALHWCAVGRWRGLPPAPPEPAKPAERLPASWTRISTPSRTLFLSPDDSEAAASLRRELLDTMNQPSASARTPCDPPEAADDVTLAVLETRRERTVFRLRENGLTVEKAVLADYPTPFRLASVPEMPFLRGDYVWPELRDLRAAGRNDELLDRTASLLKEAFRAFRAEGDLLRPESLDALPHNAIRTPDGIRFFDINRSLLPGVPPAWLVLRTVQIDLGEYFVRAGLPPLPLRHTHAHLCRVLDIRPEFAHLVPSEERLRWLSRPVAFSRAAPFLVPFRSTLSAAVRLASSLLEPRLS